MVTATTAGSSSLSPGTLNVWYEGLKSREIGFRKVAFGLISTFRQSRFSGVGRPCLMFEKDSVQFVVAKHTAEFSECKKRYQYDEPNDC
jgi:hypothetical protein